MGISRCSVPGGMHVPLYPGCATAPASTSPLVLLLLLLQVRGGFQQALELVAGEADAADGALPEPSAAAEAIEAALFKLHGRHGRLLLLLKCSFVAANSCWGFQQAAASCAVHR